jgi:hypothetical protein
MAGRKAQGEPDADCSKTLEAASYVDTVTVELLYQPALAVFGTSPKTWSRGGCMPRTYPVRGARWGSLFLKRGGTVDRSVNFNRRNCGSTLWSSCDVSFLESQNKHPAVNPILNAIRRSPQMNGEHQESPPTPLKDGNEKNQE